MIKASALRHLQEYQYVHHMPMSLFAALFRSFIFITSPGRTTAFAGSISFFRAVNLSMRLASKPTFIFASNMAVAIPISELASVINATLLFIITSYRLFDTWHPSSL